jgi:hypothetical protein
MKTKLTLLLFVVHALACSVLPASAVDIATVDTTTVHVVGTNVIRGDQLSVAFGKINTNFAAIVGWIQDQPTNAAVNSNAVLSSYQITTYSTNYAYWSASNYLARVPGLYRWTINGGTDGGGGINLAPAMEIPVSLVGSFDDVTWFAITNGFSTTNLLSVSLVTNGPNARGNTLVVPGSATLYSIVPIELLGRTNYYVGQHQRFGIPLDPADAATKSYVDILFANAVNGNFAASSSSNIFRLTYSYQGLPLLDLASMLDYIGIASFVIADQTNAVISVEQTNLTAGWQLQSSSNLLLIAGFTPFTNYVQATNAGLVTFTIPVDVTVSAQFFRIIGPRSSLATFTCPVTISSLTLTPRTVTNSTDAAAGPGMVCLDTNYVYVSVATNRWKRAALSSW